MADEKDLQTPPEPEVVENAEQQAPAGAEAAVSEEAAAAEAGQEDAPGAAGNSKEADAEAEMMAMLEDLPDDEQKANVDDINFGSTSVSKAEFQQLSEPAGHSQSRNIDLLMDVNLPISIELGRTRMSISDILALGPGSVVELNKLAGEPVDLLVNQKVVAKGEVVVIDENFGVRITQLMTPEERLKSLGEEA